jgi:DNA polymerase-3 subunit alpha
MIENLKQIRLLSDMGNRLDDIGFVFIDYPEYSSEFLCEQEKELIGFNLRYHPIQAKKEWLQEKAIPLLSELAEKSERDVVFAAALIGKRKIKTKKQEEMAFLEFGDMVDRVSGVLFPEKYQLYKNDLDNHSLWIVEGKLEKRNQDWQVVVRRLRSL